MCLSVISGLLQYVDFVDPTKIFVNQCVDLRDYFWVIAKTSHSDGVPHYIFSSKQCSFTVFPQV